MVAGEQVHPDQALRSLRPCWTVPLVDVRSEADPAAEATAQSAQSARSAGVQVRELAGLAELAAVVGLFDDIWHPAPDNPPVTAELMRAMAHAGGYVVGAFAGADLVAGSVGFFGPPQQRCLHSHITGVSASMRGREVGVAVKLHQRAWALARGVTRITWTFDPLVARNAAFNVSRLAATPVGYLRNFYGGLQDAINADDESDRLFLHWELATAGVRDALAGRRPAVDAGRLAAAGADVLLGRDDDGAPLPGAGTGAATALVAVPGDIEALRTRDPGLARRWRLAVRDSLGGLIDQGAQVVGYDRAGWYVVQVSPQQTSPSKPTPTKGTP